MDKNILNPKLYAKAKKIADDTYKKPSAYKSMFIQKKYMELGGKYKKKGKGLATWRKEKWVSVKEYLEGNIVECGDDKIGKNACRPTKRINKDTAITIQQVIKKFGKAKVKRAVNKKIKNMKLRLDWDTLTFS